MKAWKFSDTATDNVENFVGAKVYEIRRKLDVGDKLSREEKNWVAENLNNNLYSKTAIHRFASVEEIVDAYRFCIDNSFVNGSLIEVNGGYSYK